MNNKCWFSILVSFCLLSFSFTASSQSVSGVPGYVRIPVATFNDDGTMFFGTSFLPQKHLPYTQFDNNALAVYVSLTFLSFIEVDLRVTRRLNYSGSSHVVDRVPTVRLRLLKEKKWIPAVTFGFHDILTSIESGAARHFGASYIVATKNFHIPELHLKIGTTAGWGASSLVWKNNEFIGFFGGLSLGLDNIKWMELLCDYGGGAIDNGLSSAGTINAGIRFVCFRHLYMTAATMNFDSFTGTISYRFNLIR